MSLLPRHPVPQLLVPTLDGGHFALGATPAPAFEMVVFYRGLHCPICAKYLTELARLLPEFEQRGVGAIAVSSDDEERTREMAKKTNAGSLRMGYGLSLKSARQWGLTISTSRGKTSIGIEEPALFSEPGLFLVRPDGTLYWGSTQTMPFARPHFDEILGAIDFVVKNDYPARGEYTGEV
ncbi:MAG: AhpC/TSA family protein [Gammaproteobacteria bacterium]|nr:AhpC/TSA family protein [Gammaproteobacteria bacterium]MBU1644811.1 AhpC/TSA family protein [Gammaproteobacteria bacterium]MBU1973044.1 AhpC/TSA family protein [Gammaproteobacteria bacterium]